MNARYSTCPPCDSMLTFALLVAATTAVYIVQRVRADRTPELGSVSVQWLAEQRASSRP